jgi:hypothetical protein
MLFAILVIIFVPRNAANAISKSSRGWELNQNSNFAGGFASKITKEALRIDLKDLKLVIVVKAPKWDSSIYNLKTHEFFNLSYKELLKLLGGFRNNQFDENQYITYETKLTNSKLRIADLRTIDGTIKRKDIRNKTKSNKIAEFWMAPDIKVPKKIIDVFSSLVGLNNLDGMPVRYCRYREDEEAVLFNTLSANNTLVPDKDFSRISGFRNGGKVNKLFNQILGNAVSSLEDEDISPKPKQ